MKIGIVTDSTSDIPSYLVEQHEIEVVPTILILDGKEYADGVGISRDDFYKRLPSFQTSPTTAAPSIGEFSTRYESMLARGCDHIISIHVSGLLSTVVNSARQAAQDFMDKVTVVDSLSLSMGIGFQVIAAAEAAENGLQVALNAIESTRKRLKVFAALDTMENLRRSGRIPGAVAALGGLLSIKPVVEVLKGEVKPIAAVRTTKQANERMLNLLLQGNQYERLAIIHTGAEQRAKEFLHTVMQTASQATPRDILMVNATTVIGTHVGPNGLGFAAVAK
jgi:DegV family protein with EDD domain